MGTEGARGTPLGAKFFETPLRLHPPSLNGVECPYRRIILFEYFIIIVFLLRRRIGQNLGILLLLVDHVVVVIVVVVRVVVELTQGRILVWKWNSINNSIIIVLTLVQVFRLGTICLCDSGET